MLVRVFEAVARARSGSIVWQYTGAIDTVQVHTFYICMAAVCQSVQIQMYVCNLSKNFSLAMILVTSDILYIYCTVTVVRTQRS